MENIKINTLSQYWKRYHLTIFYGSSFIAALLLVFMMFTSKVPADMTIEKQVWLYAGIYVALFALMALIYYLLFYLPNYIFYKRMIKEGHEKEIMRMIEKHGFNKLVTKRWFVLRDMAGLSEKSKKGSE